MISQTIDNRVLQQANINTQAAKEELVYVREVKVVLDFNASAIAIAPSSQILSFEILKRDSIRTTSQKKIQLSTKN